MDLPKMQPESTDFIAVFIWALNASSSPAVRVELVDKKYPMIIVERANPK